MNHRTVRLQSIKALRLMILGSLLLAVPAGASGELGSRFVIDAGVVRPLGELGTEFNPERLGLGADDGYEAGFYLSIPLSRTVSINPGFHFVDFERYVITDAAENEFHTEALSFRYTVELSWSPRAESRIRPVFGLSAGLYRNRVAGYYDNPFGEKRSDSVNTLGSAIRVGVATGNFELGFLIHRNRVETWKFFEDDEVGKYNWNNLAMRLGYRLPW